MRKKNKPNNHDQIERGYHGDARYQPENNNQLKGYQPQNEYASNDVYRTRNSNQLAGCRPQNGYGQSVVPPRRKKKSIYKKPIFWLLIFLVLIGLGGAYIIMELPDTELAKLISEQNESFEIASIFEESKNETNQEEVAQQDTETQSETQLETQEKIEIEPERDTVYYYYNQLSTEEQSLYNSILEGITEIESTVMITCDDAEAMQVIIDKIWLDHAELFWWDGAYSYSARGNEVTFTFTYQYDANEIESRMLQIETKREEILNAIDYSISEYEVIKQIYEYVIDSVSYVEGAIDNQNIYSSMINKESVCAGYAREMQYLLNALEIPCIYVRGAMDDGESHAWNIVECNDKYYQVDATHGDGEVTDNAAEVGYEMVNYSYLCITDDEMCKNRIQETEYDVPICDANDLNYYKLNDSYYEVYSEAITVSMEESVYKGETMWTAQFAEESVYTQVLEEVENGSYLNIVGKYLEANQYVGSYSSNYISDEVRWSITCWY